MSCQLEDSQIQSWLDGDCDLSQHLQDCPQCQQRMSAMQKLRGRLTPPPSPLGRDFARRTAQQILSVTDKVGPSKPWGVRDNPLVHIVQRERARRMLRAPHPALIFLIYMLPGAVFFRYGDADARWAYFGMLQLGLTVLIPLLLLSLEWVTLSSLVRGRCLEEILQTGLGPSMVSDTLALNGLRSLMPALLLTGLALLPLHPQGLLLWLPMTILAFTCSGYLSQAHLVGRNWPRLISFLGVAAVAGALAAPMPWNFLSGAVLALLGLAARRQSVNSLSEQQQGLPTVRAGRRIWAVQTWLARRLPEVAILQRELLRRNLFNLAVLSGNLGICVASYTMFGWNAYSWPLFAAACSLLCAFSLVNREKDGGAFEVLLQSGLQPSEWWRSAQWLAGIQMAPALLAAVLAAGWQNRALGSFSQLAAGLGTACSLLVSLHAGAVIGANLGLKTSTSRQAASRGVMELALLGLSSLLMIGLVPTLLGPGSLLMSLLRPLGIQMQDALEGFAVLPVMLALYLRVRSLQKMSTFNPWTSGLALCAPICVWLQLATSYQYGVGGEANYYAGVSLLIALGWSWWAAPLAKNPGPKRWISLATGYVLAQVLGLPLLVWCLSILRNFASSSVPQALHEIDSFQLLACSTGAAWLIYLLGRQRGWQAPPAPTCWRRRSAWAGLTLLCLLSSFAWGMLRLKNTPRAHAAEFESFLASHQAPVQGPSWLRRTIRDANVAQHMYLPSLTDGSLNNTYNTRDFNNYLKHRQQFEQLFNQLLEDPARGNQQDREWALQLLEMQCNSDLEGRRLDSVLHDLDQMARFCRQADQLGYPRTRASCLRLRSRAFLACRSQVWTESGLRRLDDILTGMPDDEKHNRRIQDQLAVHAYDLIRNNQAGRGERLNADPVTRFFLQQQAELFLDAYLSGQTGHWGSDLARGVLWQMNWNSQRESDQRKLAYGVNRIARLLEGVRLDTGHYPTSLSSPQSGLRIAYHPTADGSYYLRAWLPRAGGRPMVLTSSGPSYKLSDFYDYWED